MKKLTTLLILFLATLTASAENKNELPVTFTKTAAAFSWSTPFSVSPASGTQGQNFLTVTFTSNGTPFGTTTSCLHLDTSNIILSSSNYPGVTIHAFYLKLLDSTHMNARFNIPVNATQGYYDVQIGNGCMLTLTKGFYIGGSFASNDFTAQYNQNQELGATLFVTFTDQQNRFYNASTNCLHTDSSNVLFIHNPTGVTYKPATSVVHYVNMETFWLTVPPNAPIGSYDIVAGQGSQCPLMCYGCLYIAPNLIFDGEISPKYGRPGENKLISFSNQYHNGAYNCMTLDTTLISFTSNKPVYGQSFHAYNYNIINGDSMLANVQIPPNAVPGLYNVTLGTGPCAKSCLNCFSITTSDSLADLAVYYNVTPMQVRPAGTINHTIVLNNLGIKTVKPGMVVTLDPSCNAGQPTSSPLYDSLVNNTLYYSFDSLDAGKAITISLSSVTDSMASIGALLVNTAKAYPTLGDFDTTNNISAAQLQVVNSFDPNAKYVFPAGPITPAQVSSHMALDYVVEFQNTGNAPAIDIVVVDTLSWFLDLSTFRLISSSDYCSYNLSASGILTVTFHNIMLPDSTSDEPHSHGFFRYEIVPKTSMNIGDVIYNRADIYFDNNAPVLTNITATALAANGVKNGVVQNEYVIYPNPSSGMLRIMGPELRDGRVVIVDAGGKEALNLPYNHFVNAESLPAGFYFVFLRNKEGAVVSVNKLIKK